MSADWDKIKLAVASVTLGDQTVPVGTAFYVGEKYALTALHVIADTKQKPPLFSSKITLRFPNNHTTDATVADGMWDQSSDWVVVECKNAPTIAPMPLGALPRKDDKWSSFGYPEIHQEGKTISGEVRDPNGRYGDAAVIELFCDDAAAGAGARLHGFSGAPCISNDAAVGILRSTLIETLPDGRLRPQLFTQAGTVFACPSQAIIGWQAAKRVAVLPESWSPPEIVLKDFVVFLSKSENKHRVKLRAVAEGAYEHVKDLGIGSPCFEDAVAVISSREKLVQTIPALCRAKVIVFDASGFEPAIMLLAGIRATVKRGVTILSIGGNYALGGRVNIPFNVTDANIVAHSAKQDKQGPTSIALLSTRIRRGFGEMGSPFYLDMPVYDSLRRLPADRRGIIPREKGTLVLCPFDEQYTKDYWRQNLKHALDNELTKLREGQKLDPDDLGVARSFELNSPRLVTHAVYEMIRRAQLCIVDLTKWSPNVLFELGVRLAAAREGAACLIEKGWRDKVPPEWKQQCEDLVGLLVPEESIYDPRKYWAGEKAYAKAYSAGGESAPALGRGDVHALVASSLDIESEPASRSTYQEIRDSAATFAKDPGKAGRSKPVGLFSINPELPRREEEAEFERLLAAWFYLYHRRSSVEPAKADEMQKAGAEISQTLFERHATRLEKLREKANDELTKILDKLEETFDSTEIRGDQ